MPIWFGRGRRGRKFCLVHDDNPIGYYAASRCWIDNLSIVVCKSYPSRSITIGSAYRWMNIVVDILLWGIFGLY